jgi:hypothetical protein
LKIISCASEIRQLTPALPLLLLLLLMLLLLQLTSLHTRTLHQLEKAEDANMTSGGAKKDLEEVTKEQEKLSAEVTRHNNKKFSIIFLHTIIFLLSFQHLLLALQRATAAAVSHWYLLRLLRLYACAAQHTVAEDDRRQYTKPAALDVFFTPAHATKMPASERCMHVLTLTHTLSRSIHTHTCYMKTGDTATR